MTAADPEGVVVVGLSEPSVQTMVDVGWLFKIWMSLWHPQ